MNILTSIHLSATFQVLYDILSQAYGGGGYERGGPMWSLGRVTALR